MNLRLYLHLVGLYFGTLCARFCVSVKASRKSVDSRVNNAVNAAQKVSVPAPATEVTRPSRRSRRRRLLLGPSKALSPTQPQAPGQDREIGPLSWQVSVSSNGVRCRTIWHVAFEPKAEMGEIGTHCSVGGDYFFGQSLAFLIASTHSSQSLSTSCCWAEFTPASAGREPV